MPQNKYINTKDVVELTGLSTSEVLNLAKTGVLPTHKTRRGHYRFNVEAVEKYFGIQINEPVEEVGMPVTAPMPTKEPKPEEKIPIESCDSYVADEDHYTQVFKRMTEVKHSLKIATANLKNFNVFIESEGKEEKLRLCYFFLSLVERGVHVQIVCMKPFGFYLYAKEKCPQLLNNPLFELRYNEHNHMKVFIFDNECAYFGSANITEAAIGKRANGHRNHEAGLLVSGSMLQAPMHHFEISWNDPDILKHTWKRFAEEAKKKTKSMKKRYGK